MESWSSGRLGWPGIEQDSPHPGRGASVRVGNEVEIIRKTPLELPADATQWSVRTMAATLGLSKDTVRRDWRENGLKPHRIKTFEVSRDPKFAQKLANVVGLYLNPPEHAFVLSVDEQTRFKHWMARNLRCRCFQADWGR